MNSFKRLIHSETSQLSVLMNGPLNHWLTRFIQTAYSFRNESIVCPYEWATESLTHSIHLNGWFIQKRVNCLSLWMGHESLTHSIHSNGWFIQKRVNCLSLWMGHWIIDSLDSFKPDSFRNESIVCPYEWATESLTHSIQSNGWFIQKRVNWLSLWMGHWIIDSLDSFKLLIHQNESIGCPYEWATESLTHSIHSNTWIRSETKHCVCCSETHNSCCVFDRNYCRQRNSAKTVNILSKI